MGKKKLIVYGIIFLLLGGLALWIFVKPDNLKELKQTEIVTEGAEEPKAVVDEALKAVAAKDTGKLASCMLLGHDKTEVESLTELLYASPSFCPAEIKECRRLVKSHRKDNITVYVFSENRKQTYAFTMLKNEDGAYKISTVVPSPRKF